MRGVRVRGSWPCIAGVLGVFALTGCVPGAYVYESPSPAYYGGGYGYYAPAGYYAYPGYYRPAYPSTRVVYVDHDHRGDDCRHESHRDRRSYDRRDRDHDHDRQQDRRDEHRPRDARGPVPPVPRVPPAKRIPPADRPPPVREACAGNKCGSPGAATVGDTMAEPRTPGRRRSTMRPHPADPP